MSHVRRSREKQRATDHFRHFFEVPIAQQYKYPFKTGLNIYKIYYVSLWFSLHESRRNFGPIFAKDFSPLNKIVNKKSMMLSFFHGLRPTAKLR